MPSFLHNQNTFGLVKMNLLLQFFTIDQESIQRASLHKQYINNQNPFLNFLYEIASDSPCMMISNKVEQTLF